MHWYTNSKVLQCNSVPIVLSPDLIRHVYRLQYNVREKAIRKRRLVLVWDRDYSVPKVMLLHYRKSGNVQYLNIGRVVQLTASNGKLFHREIENVYLKWFVRAKGILYCWWWLYLYLAPQEIWHPCTIFPRQSQEIWNPLPSQEIFQISWRDTILPLGSQIACDTSQNRTSQTGSSFIPRLLVDCIVEPEGSIL